MKGLLIVCGPKGTGKTYNRQRFGESTLATIPSLFGPAGDRAAQLKNRDTTLYVPFTSTDLPNASPENCVRIAKAVLELQPAKLIIEVDSDETAAALQDYFCGSELVRHSVCDTAWFKGLSQERQTIAARYAWLPVAIHMKAQQSTDAHTFYNEVCCRYSGLDIIKPQNRFGFFLSWQLELSRALTSGRATLVNLVSPPGMAKTEGVEAIAAHFGWELLSVDPHRLTEGKFGATAERFEKYFESINQYASTAASRCVAFIDEADSLFPKSTRDTDIAGELRAVKFKFNRWLRTMHPNIMLVMASNHPLEPSIASRGESLLVTISGQDLINVLTYTWPGPRERFQSYAGLVGKNGAFDLRILKIARRKWSERPPTAEELKNLIDAQHASDSLASGEEGIGRGRSRDAELARVLNVCAELARQNRLLGEEVAAINKKQNAARR